MTANVRARGVGLEVGGATILDDVDLTAGAGRLLGLAGPSGSGKTSLLHILAGLVTPTSGRVDYGDDGPIGPGRAAVVLQNFGLAPTLTATENVALPLLTSGRSATAASTCGEVLARFGLAEVADHLVGELSGGQRQRVALARAVARRCDVVLADEPTAALDAAWRSVTLAGLADEAGRGAVVVVASHDPEVLAVCDEVVTLEGGRVLSGPGHQRLPG